MKSARDVVPTEYSILRDVARAAEQHERLFVQGLKLVGRAQVEIGGGELNLRGELRIGEIGGARLRRRRIGLDRAADAAPDVELPAGVRGVGEAVRIDRVAAGRGRAASRRRIIRGDGRKKAGLALPNDLLGLVIGRGGGCDILIGEFDLGEELRERRIVEDAPPGTAIRLVERRDRLPALARLGGPLRHAATLFELGRDDVRGADIVGPGHAAGERCDRHCRRAHARQRAAPPSRRSTETHQNHKRAFADQLKPLPTRPHIVSRSSSRFVAMRSSAGRADDPRSRAGASGGVRPYRTHWRRCICDPSPFAPSPLPKTNATPPSETRISARRFRQAPSIPSLRGAEFMRCRK